MISPTAYAVAAIAYLCVGVVAWRVAERHNFDGESWRLIYQWPGTAAVAVVALTLVWSAIWDETHDDDRAQTGPTPIWIPGLLTALVISWLVLREVVKLL
jgi:hypothetical protein